MKPRLTPAEWAKTHRKYPEHAGVPGDRDPWLTPYFVPFTDAVAEGKYRRYVAACGAQMGKALALDTPIATPAGWATMGQLRAGDTVFGSDGRPVRVIVAHPVMTDHPCFEVVFDDGERIVADADHIWTVSRTERNGRNRRTVNMTTAEMVAEGPMVERGGKRRNLFSVPVAGALDLPPADLPVDPYLLGVWLGDGNARAPRISVGDEDLEAMRRQIEACGYETNAARERTCWRVGVFEPGMRGRRGGLNAKLTALGVIADKHIPAAYMRASGSQRLALLQGIMDTDGGVENGTIAGFTATGRELAEQVRDLAASLGYLPRLSRHKLGHWRVRVQCYRESTVFRLPRKTAALRSEMDGKARPWQNRRRSIVAINPVPSVPVRCIGVDAPDHLFLAGRALIATHNTDSTLDLIGSKLDQKPEPILYVGPTYDFLSDQFEPRIMDLLDEAETLKNKVVRGRRMKKTLKWVSGVKLRLAAAGSPAAIKSDSMALGIIDEYDDENMVSTLGQGSILGLLEARGDTYAGYRTVVTSTPSNGLVDTYIDEETGLEFWAVTDPDDLQSRIWRIFQEGTRYHWAWRCKHCDEFFIPRFKQLRWPKDATPGMARRDAWVECPRCGGVHVDEDKEELNAGGVPIAPGQQIIDGEVVGSPAETATFSIWASGLCSPFVSFGQRAETYLTAKQQGDHDEIQTAMNAAFGECYSMTGGADMPEWQEIMERRLPYRMGEIPAGGLRLFMAVDVQKFSLIYVIRAFGSRGTSWLVENGQIYGPTDQEGVWDELTSVMFQPIAGMQIEQVFIDSGFRPNKVDGANEHKVYEFCRRYSWMCKPTKGRDVQMPPYRVSKIEVKKDGKKAVYSIDLVTLSTDFFKQLLLARIRTPLGVAGAFYVHEEVDEDYCRQVVSEARLVIEGKPTWVKRYRDNHFLDCEAMLQAMAYANNMQRVPEGIERRTDDGGDEPDDPPPSPDKPTTPPPPAPNAETSAEQTKLDLRKKFARYGANARR